MLGRRPRFYAETTEMGNALWVDIYDRGNRNTLLAWVKTEMKSPKIVWTDVQICNQKSSLAFIRTFRRSAGQELMLRAAKWGKKNGATHVDLENLCEQGGRMLQRGMEFGLLSKEGKILKVPRQLNLKENRLLEKPIIRRKSLIRKPRGKHLRRIRK